LAYCGFLLKDESIKSVKYPVALSSAFQHFGGIRNCIIKESRISGQPKPDTSTSLKILYSIELPMIWNHS